MRVLVTGATGCVGANIVEALLTAGYEVRALRRTTSRLDALEGLEPEFAVGDVTEYESLLPALEGCHLVFHTAGISQYWRNRPELIYEVNVEGTRKVLRAAREQGVGRVVFTSSAAVLGVPSSPGQLLVEGATFNLPPRRFPYGHSKVLAEEVVGEALAQGQDVVIVNPVSVVGRRDVSFVGGEFLRAARRGRALAAPPGGMGVVSARDVGRGHLLAAERGQTGGRYLLNGENVPYRSFMGIVAEEVGARPPLFTIPRLAMGPFAVAIDLWNRLRGGTPLISGNQVRLSARCMYFDATKARAELGFEPVTAREAVAEAWSWYRSQGML